MADRKKPKSNKKKDKRNGDMKATKEEKNIAYHVRFNCATKTTLMQQEDAHYFNGSAAIDCLLASKWGSDKSKNQLFSNRKEATIYMNGLLNKGMLFRARKLVAKKKEPKSTESEKPKGEDAGSSLNDEQNKDVTQKSAKKNKKDKSKEDEEEKKTSKDDDKETKKKPKKVKLDFHSEQIFLDTLDSVYVWVYDPTSWWKFILGLFIVFGSIVVCLFPLWPAWLRLGVYYCSLVAMGLVGIITVLVVLRSILFGLVWIATWGNHHFWLLPNLTEDCGFLESFQPLFTHQNAADKEKEERKKKKGKAKDEDADLEVDDENIDEAQDSEIEKDAESSASEMQPTPEQKGIRKRRGVRREDCDIKEVSAEESGTNNEDNESVNGFELVDTDSQ